MTPKLKISSATRYYEPHTRREFLEEYYPELLEAAESGCKVLSVLQETLVKLLPLSKQLLPSNINQLGNVEAQANFMVYIYHYSLFAFADKVYGMLKTECTALAEALNANDSQKEVDAADRLRKILEALSKIPFDNLLDQSATGLLRLNIFKDYLQDRFDFLVIPVLKEDGTPRGHWSFRDITGTMLNHGLSYHQLLTDCINAPLPGCSTIGKVVDDEEMVRIY